MTIERRADLGITPDVIGHLTGIFPYLNQVVGLAQNEKLKADERAALMFTVASYFFSAAAQARHLSAGGDDDLPIPPDLIRDLGVELAERYNEALEAARRSRQ